MLRTSSLFRNTANNLDLYLRLMPKTGAKYVLLLGSNLGDRMQILESAAQSIEKEIGSILKSSSIHETEPWGFDSQDLFLNQAVLVQTDLDPFEILDKIHRIESKLGRIRQKEQWVSRVIDIDILCCDQFSINTDTLSIPHARLHERGFALAPLCELVPNWIHQLKGIRYQDLLDAVNEKQPIQIA